MSFALFLIHLLFLGTTFISEYIIYVLVVLGPMLRISCFTTGFTIQLLVVSVKDSSAKLIRVSCVGLV